MTLEISLVSTDSIYGSVFTLLNRKRYTSENLSGADAIDYALDFLSENINTLDAILVDKNLINIISSKQTLSIMDFLSLKFMMAQSGVDVLMYAVADNEVNQESIPNNIREYNILDNTSMIEGFIPTVIKYSVDEISGNIGDVYSRMLTTYNPFNKTIFGNTKNPIEANVNTLINAEKVSGNIVEGLVVSINSLFLYLGKTINVIYPKS